jgi:DNA modification methylase
MELEKIIELWNEDCKIDETELGAESVKTPQIHNKYLKIFTQEKLLLTKHRCEEKKIRKLLTEYYSGELTPEELKKIGREQFYKRLVKNSVNEYVESDEEMINAVFKIAIQEEKVNYLEAIIKSLNNRGFVIKNAIDWLKFTSG